MLRPEHLTYSDDQGTLFVCVRICCALFGSSLVYLLASLCCARLLAGPLDPGHLAAADDQGTPCACFLVRLFACVRGLRTCIIVRLLAGPLQSGHLTYAYDQGAPLRDILLARSLAWFFSVALCLLLDCVIAILLAHIWGSVEHLGTVVEHDACRCGLKCMSASSVCALSAARVLPIPSTMVAWRRWRGSMSLFLLL